jgi:transposase
VTNKLLETCLTIARHYLPKHSRADGYKHYSFIIQKNQLIEWATNRSGPPIMYLGYKNHQMIHSETQAYKKAKGLLHKESFEVINIRLNSKGELKISKPCHCCTVFLRNLGCRTIWFSQSYENIFSKVIL